jgi:hypothetical protein
MRMTEEGRADGAHRKRYGGSTPCTEYSVGGMAILRLRKEREVSGMAPTTSTRQAWDGSLATDRDAETFYYHSMYSVPAPTAESSANSSSRVVPCHDLLCWEDPSGGDC